MLLGNIIGKLPEIRNMLVSSPALFTQNYSHPSLFMDPLEGAASFGKELLVVAQKAPEGLICHALWKVRGVKDEIGNVPIDALVIERVSVAVLAEIMLQGDTHVYNKKGFEEVSKKVARVFDIWTKHLTSPGGLKAKDLPKDILREYARSGKSDRLFLPFSVNREKGPAGEVGLIPYPEVDEPFSEVSRMAFSRKGALNSLRYRTEFGKDGIAGTPWPALPMTYATPDIRIFRRRYEGSKGAIAAYVTLSSPDRSYHVPVLSSTQCIGRGRDKSPIFSRVLDGVIEVATPSIYRFSHEGRQLPFSAKSRGYIPITLTEDKTSGPVLDRGSLMFDRQAGVGSLIEAVAPMFVDYMNIVVDARRSPLALFWEPFPAAWSVLFRYKGGRLGITRIKDDKSGRLDSLHATNPEIQIVWRLEDMKRAKIYGKHLYAMGGLSMEELAKIIDTEIVVRRL